MARVRTRPRNSPKPTQLLHDLVHTAFTVIGDILDENMNIENSDPDPGQEIRRYLRQYVKLIRDGNAPFPLEFWNPLQLACSIGDVSCVKTLLEIKGAEVLEIPKGGAVPRVNPLHLCSIHGHTELLSLLTNPSNINSKDQWGFTALHYAAFHRKLSSLIFLLENGADPAAKSEAGNTALDIATELGFHDIADILASKIKLTSDPTLPQFREWLRAIGAGMYFNSFLQSGYDLKFIAQHGLSDEDLNSVGVPSSQMGIRRKLKVLHRLDEFIPVDKEEADEGEEEDQVSDGSEESESEEDI